MSHLLIIDGEFTGPCLKKNAMFEFGAIVVDVKHNKVLADLSCLINIPSDRTWSETTLNDFWLNNEATKDSGFAAKYEKLSKNQGMSIQSAMDKFYDFCIHWWNQLDGDLVIGSDHPDIDGSWFNTYLSIADKPMLHLIFGKLTHVVAIASYHQGTTHTLHSEVLSFSKNHSNWSHIVNVQNYFNIPFSKTKSSHDALQDAKMLGETHVNTLKAIELIKKSSYSYYVHQ